MLIFSQTERTGGRIMTKHDIWKIRQWLPRCYSDFSSARRLFILLGAVEGTLLQYIYYICSNSVTGSAKISPELCQTFIPGMDMVSESKIKYALRKLKKNNLIENWLDTENGKPTKRNSSFALTNELHNISSEYNEHKF